MNIGIFGGSFDPIHNGHIRLAQYALGHTDLDQLWLMVSPRNPLKDHGPIATDGQRLEMARLAVAGIPGVEVSDFEFHLPIPSYTYKTLTELQKAYPEHQFRLLIGGDNWDNFHLWRNPEEIISQFGLIVYPRSDNNQRSTINNQQSTSNEQRATSNGIVFLENAPLMPVSSTQIRSLLKEKSTDPRNSSSESSLSAPLSANSSFIINNSSLENHLPPSVLDYIRKNSLYKV